MFPIKNSENNFKITSGFGSRKYAYKGNIVEDFHNGVDLISTTKETEIVAFDKGVVINFCNEGKQYGQACFVVIQHDGYITRYYHLKSGSVKVKLGQEVNEGDLLGIMGKTGQANGVHLHFQIDYGDINKAINPLIDNRLRNPSEIIKDDKLSLQEDYFKIGNNYTLQTDLNVRSNAGTIFSLKLVKHLTLDGQKHAISTNPNSFAVLKKGTVVTCQDVIKKSNGQTWLKIPSGYVCAISRKGEYFIK